MVWSTNCMCLSCIETRNCWAPLSILLGQLPDGLIQTLSILATHVSSCLHTLRALWPSLSLLSVCRSHQKKFKLSLQRKLGESAARQQPAQARPRRGRARQARGQGGHQGEEQVREQGPPQPRLTLLRGLLRERKYLCYVEWTEFIFSVHTSWCIFIIKLHNNLAFIEIKHCLFCQIHMSKNKNPCSVCM